MSDSYKSLVQLFTYAAKIKKEEEEEFIGSCDPQIAIIDLSAPCLNVPNKKHAAVDVIRRLRDVGEMTQTLYRGECEVLLFGNIPVQAILSIVNLSTIKTLSDNEPAVAGLLHLEHFDEAASTRTACEMMRRENIKLNGETAIAMGLLARTLGIDGQGIKEQHIFDFVTRSFDVRSLTVSTFTHHGGTDLTYRDGASEYLMTLMILLYLC